MKTLSKILLSGLTAAALLTVAGCATESNRAMPVAQVASANVAYSGVRVPIAVGKFDNRSSYMRGIFSDGVDRLGGQAKTILITHLQQTNRFSVLDRDNMGEISQEAKIKGTVQKLKGAEYALSNREVIGFGGTASYDSTLNGKVLDLAMREAINRLVDGINAGAWNPRN